MTVSVCSGCQNKTPQTGTSTTETHFSEFQRLDLPDRGVGSCGFSCLTGDLLTAPLRVPGVSSSSYKDTCPTGLEPETYNLI